jgi:hypothetical protein
MGVRRLPRRGTPAAAPVGPALPPGCPDTPAGPHLDPASWGAVSAAADHVALDGRPYDPDGAVLDRLATDRVYLDWLARGAAG